MAVPLLCPKWKYCRSSKTFYLLNCLCSWNLTKQPPRQMKSCILISNREFWNLAKKGVQKSLNEYITSNHNENIAIMIKTDIVIEPWLGPGYVLNTFPRTISFLWPRTLWSGNHYYHCLTKGEVSTWVTQLVRKLGCKPRAWALPHCARFLILILPRIKENICHREIDLVR